jgi:cytochrome c-type biogenesis protein
MTATHVTGSAVELQTGPHKFKVSLDTIGYLLLTNHKGYKVIESLVINLASILPFGYAFTAGMATTVSPCAIAMLPAYVSLHLGTEEGGLLTGSTLQRLIRAIVMSVAVTLSFVVFFGIVGALLSIGGQFLINFIPWITILISVALILLGIFLVTGAHMYVSLPGRLAARLGNPGGAGIRGFIVFGIAYAIAALGCTLPVFLVVVASALAVGDFTSGLFQFVSYALGMGFIIIVVSIGSVLFKEMVNRWLRRLVPVVVRLSGFLLIFAGGYILYFWFAVGDILSWIS